MSERENIGRRDLGSPAEAREHLSRLKEKFRTVIRGQAQATDQLLIALLCGGHAILEGVPGTAKTLMVKTLARLMRCSFKRIQFTPDLMPSDITGTHIFNMKENAFELRRGPVFTDLLLADEINRAPAKTQAALLEAMQERQVTIGEETLKLPGVFTVFATQNPIEYEGVYPLPEAQLDRFLLKIQVDYPAGQDEQEIVAAYHAGNKLDLLDRLAPDPELDPGDLDRYRLLVEGVRVDDSIRTYIVEIVRRTRTEDALLVGAGVRASIGLLLTAKARAFLEGRDYVIPDDVISQVGGVLAHRVILKAESEIEGVAKPEILQRILDNVNVPR